MSEPLFDLRPTVREEETIAAKCTERDVLDSLTRRYSERYGNGYRWAYAEHVKSSTGFSLGQRLRIADAIAVDCWQSKGDGGARPRGEGVAV